MKFSASICLLAVFLLTPLASHALPSETLNKTEIRHVVVYWSAFPIADFITSFVPDTKGNVKATAIITTSGLAKTITRYGSETKTDVVYEKGQYRPVSYTTKFDFRKKTRNIAITYKDDGSVKSYRNDPPENPGKRPPVPASQTKGAYDPLTAFLVARQKVIESYKGGAKKFSLPLYDGRRRSDIAFEVLPEEKGLVHVALKEVPVAGFTNNEKQEKKNRGDTTIHVYLDKTDFLPVKARGVSMVGEAHGIMTSKCTTLESCMKR
ncbi:MAG: DUF3108 domain-containing protein [Proteobacteria bacterium]|nr:DUF3108 domain-containing protein [Pseudomonadota bacterium]